MDKHSFILIISAKINNKRFWIWQETIVPFEVAWFRSYMEDSLTRPARVWGTGEYVWRVKRAWQSWIQPRIRKPSLLPEQQVMGKKPAPQMPPGLLEPDHLQRRKLLLERRGFNTYYSQRAWLIMQTCPAASFGRRTGLAVATQHSGVWPLHHRADLAFPRRHHSRVRDSSVCLYTQSVIRMALGESAGKMGACESPFCLSKGPEN